MATVLVSGALANKPQSGGEAWVRLTWLRALRRLGVDACFAEQIDPAACVDDDGRHAPFERSVNRRYFEETIAALAPDCPATLVCGGASAGTPLGEMEERARDCDLLVNVSGHLRAGPLRSGPRVSAYLDVDPGFTQIWEEGSPGSAGLPGHDHYFTVGENIGTPACSIPTAGVDWRPLPPPVTLDDWPVTPAPDPARFTTVSTWRSALGTLSFGDATFPGKHHEWRRVADLPRRSPHAFEIALSIHPGDGADRDALEAAGWQLRDPRAVADGPLGFRDYVQGSGAEFSVAHGVYVGTRSGWLSDRTVRYLAAGRPALVQDTGVYRHPVGEGLVTFRTVDDAAAAADEIVRDYDRHAQAARALAEERFDADRVVARLLDEVGVG